MLDKRVKFLLPDNLKCKQPEDEDECVKVCGCDIIDCENEDVGEEELNKFHLEFTADIETIVELNHTETFTDENDIKKRKRKLSIDDYLNYSSDNYKENTLRKF
jgi:hypothetical protein